MRELKCSKLGAAPPRNIWRKRKVNRVQLLKVQISLPTDQFDYINGRLTVTSLLCAFHLCISRLSQRETMGLDGRLALISSSSPPVVSTKNNIDCYQAYPTVKLRFHTAAFPIVADASSI